MKAFVCHSSTTSPRPQLKRQQSYTIPVPHQGQVLIRVLACGLCHTDLHVMQGDLKSPLSEWIPGHEVVGIVEALGNLKDETITEEMKGLKMREVEEKVKEEKVKVEEEIKVGDRVGVAWLHWCCGWCDLCLSGVSIRRFYLTASIMSITSCRSISRLFLYHLPLHIFVCSL